MSVSSPTSEGQVGRGSRGGLEGSGGDLTVKSRRRASLRTRLKVKNTGGIFKVCCTVHEGHKRPKR
eukprot:1746277-Pyramimonas_sp.AAC.1